MNNFDSVAISSRIRFARNVKGIEFMSKLTDENKIFYLTSSMEALLKNYGDFTSFHLADMSLQKCTSLLERHIISKELIANKDISMVSTNEDESIIVMTMEEDHLRLQSVTSGLALNEAYQKLRPLDERIACSFQIAYDDEIGYLTSSPCNLGSGMRASIMVFIPALELSGRVDEIINDARKHGLTFRGVYGEGSRALGYIYQISNQGLLNLSEEEIIDRVNDFFYNIYNEEMRLRDEIFDKNHDELCDKIARAYATLTHAYLLSEEEMFLLLSLVRFGHELALLKIRNTKLYMKLYYHGGSAYLGEIRPFSHIQEENHVRAEYIAKRVKNLVKFGGEK